MIGLMAFAISITATIMIFIPAVRLPAFVIAILGIIYGVIGGYEKEKETKDEKKKESKALEIGSIIISGAVCVCYLVILYIT